MVKLQAAARIIQTPQSKTRAPMDTPCTGTQADLFSDQELFGVKKGEFIKKSRNVDFLFRDKKIEAYADEKELAAQRVVEMKPDLYRTFISAYEELMRGTSSFRRTIQTQVRGFADCLLDSGKIYRPMTF